MKKIKNKQDLEAIINAKAWKDPKFKKKLLDDPKAALKEMGLNVSKEGKVRIVEDDKNTITFVISPEPQTSIAMEEEEFKKIAGGSKSGCCNSMYIPHILTK